MPPRKIVKDAERTHPRVWNRIRKEWLEGGKAGAPGTWNARKAQLAAKQYKKHCEEKFGDSGYKSPKGRNHHKTNSLALWTDQDWGYVSTPGGRYLPKKVRDALTPAERKKEDKLKRGKLGQHVPYTDSVTQKMRRMKIV